MPSCRLYIQRWIYNQPHHIFVLFSSDRTQISSTMSTETVNNKEPWLALFEKEYLCFERGTVEHDVASMLKDLLSDTNDDDDDDDAAAAAAHTTAHQLNSYYWERNNASGPFFRWGNERDTFPNFVTFLFDIMVRVTLFIPYNDGRQNAILQLVRELRDLPPNPVKAWDVCSSSFYFFCFPLPCSNMKCLGRSSRASW